MKSALKSKKATRRLNLSHSEADSFMNLLGELLAKRYGARQKFTIRDDLAIQEKGWFTLQINMFVGRMAGLEVIYKLKGGTDTGILSVRSCCWLEHQIKAYAAIAGFITGIVLFATLVFDGYSGNTFITGSRWIATPHFNFGAIFLYAFVPAAIVGIFAGCLFLPIQLIIRLLCLIRNSRERIETPAAFLDGVFGPEQDEMATR